MIASVAVRSALMIGKVSFKLTCIVLIGIYRLFLFLIDQHQPQKDSDIHLGKIKPNVWNLQNAIYNQEWLTEAQLNHHVHVVGASGFGKTVLLSRIVKQTIFQNKALIFIDLKADRDTISGVKSWAKEAGRENDLKFFSISDPSISSHYNLVAEGSPSQLRDRIMMALTWSEEYYKSQASSYLLKLLTALCCLRDVKHKTFTLGHVLRCCAKPEEVEKLCAEIPLEQTHAREAIEEALDFICDRERFGTLQGLRSQLENLVKSEFGHLLSTDAEGSIDLFKSIESNHIIYFLLDSRRFGEAAKSVGRLILQDLKAVSSKIDAEIPREQRKPLRLVIDEFADMATEDFISFLDRARSSKISVTVAHQELSDLKRVSEEFARRLMGNTSTLYAFLQKGPESAELISKIAGTKKVKVRTEQIETILGIRKKTGMYSEREVEEFSVHPNVIKSLRVGQAVCVKKYPLARSHLVNVQF